MDLDKKFDYYGALVYYTLIKEKNRANDVLQINYEIQEIIDGQNQIKVKYAPESPPPVFPGSIVELVHLEIEEWRNNLLTPKYVQLNKHAYRAYCVFRIERGERSFPDLILGYPIILDSKSETLVKVIGDASVEMKRADVIKEMRKNDKC